MAKMKTLTVSGQTYTVNDPEAVSFCQQVLTPSQQQTARDNIGACALKQVADSLCPSFTETGVVVVCEPVEGYPLEAAVEDGATQIIQSGKNLAEYPYSNKTKTVNGITFTDNGDGSITMDGTATANATFYLSNKGQYAVKPGVNYVAKMHVISGTYSNHSNGPGWMLNYYRKGASSYSGWMWTYKSAGSGSLPCPENMDKMASYIVVLEGTTCSGFTVKLQLEAGTTPTPYEPYKESKTYAPGELIPAFQGVNTLNADTGLITVTGRANPAPIIEKLNNAVIALGGNV